MKAGIYLHIPFCREKCDYCSFRSYPVSAFNNKIESVMGKYIQRLKNESEWWSGRFGIIEADTIYFGGGTPSLLEPVEISGVIENLRKSFRIDDNTEITIEVNPSDASEKKIAGYRDAGINRIVLGVQTLSRKLHRIIGRHGEPVKREQLENFSSIKGVSHSLDLITGIPGQSKEELIDDLEMITSFSPEHISVYLLTIDKNTPLYNRIHIDENFQDLQKESFEVVINYLKEKEYIHYEISNFALEGHRSRHNMKYWTFQPYIGFGPGAHSFIQYRRFINRMSLGDYLGPGDLELEEDVRGGYAPLVEFILTGLRLKEGISLGKMKKVTGFELPAKVSEKFDKLESDGLIRIDKRPSDHQIQLTERGILLADAIIFEAVEPLL
jgi:oxygen-independent coproporphyrinogen-3 oxidase